MPQRFALLIGNSDYDDPTLRQLKAPQADLQALAALLEDSDLGGYQVQTRLNPSFEQAQHAIGELLAERRPDDFVLLYFSGHGVLDAQDQLCLAVKNTYHLKPRTAGIWAQWLRAELDDSRARQQVLILDCCHSGAFGDGRKDEGALGRPAVLTDTFGPAGRGRVVLTATDKTSAAWEGDKIIGGVENSLFTHYLIEGIRSGAAADSLGRVTADQLYQYVYRRVIEATPQQKPRRFYDDQEGHIVIARAWPARAGQPLVARLETDLADPSSAVRLKAVDELVRLWRGDDPAQSKLAQLLLERARDDEDQIRKVSRAAGQALGGVPVEPNTRPPFQFYELKDLKPVSQPAATPAVSSNVVALDLADNVRLDLVRIPPGEFLMGSDKARDKEADDSETPQHKLALPEYLIGKAPVTVAQFAAFAKVTGHHWSGVDVEKKAQHPIANVTWRDALAFCEWAGKLTGQRVALPSEAEWEKAARGTDGRLFPWGNDEPTDKHCNFHNKFRGSTPVGQFSPLGDSPYGCVDMAGNVWELCRSKFAGYPYKPGDGREDLAGDDRRVVRGGSFYHSRRSVRCADRFHLEPDGRHDYFGFRVVVMRSADGSA